MPALYPLYPASASRVRWRRVQLRNDEGMDLQSASLYLSDLAETCRRHHRGDGAAPRTDSPGAQPQAYLCLSASTLLIPLRNCRRLRPEREETQWHACAVSPKWAWASMSMARTPPRLPGARSRMPSATPAWVSSGCWAGPRMTCTSM